MSEPVFERVTLDSSVLLGIRSREFVAAADLGYYHGFWSAWIAAEFVRVRTELAALRAIREGASAAETRARLERSRDRVNAAVTAFSRVLTLVDYQMATGADLGWLADEDDHPVMLTAIAAGVPGTLVTDNRRDFPLGEVRNDIRILGGSVFLDLLHQSRPEAPPAIAEYLARQRPY